MQPKRSLDSGDENISKANRTIRESNRIIACSRQRIMTAWAAIKASEAREQRLRERLQKKAA